MGDNSGRSRSTKPMRAARSIGEAACWLLILAGVVTFSFFWIVTPIRWYTLQNPEFLAWRNTLILEYKWANATTGRNTNLLSGGVSFILIWQWCSTLAAALGSAGLLWLAASAAAPAKSTTSQTKGRGRSLIASAKRAVTKARRLLSCQVGPRGLWRTLLGAGGLSVLDLLLILFWVGIHILWLYEMTMRILVNRWQNPPPPKVVRAPPPAIKASTSNNITKTATVTTTNVTTARNLMESSRRLHQAATVNVTSFLGKASTGASSTTSPPKVAPPPPPTVRRLKPLPHVVQDSVAKYTGWVGRLDLLLLFYPLPRCNFLHWMVGTDFPALIKYHRWLGHGTMAVFSVHGIIYLGIWARDGTMNRQLTFDMDSGVNNVAGLVSLAGGWLLWVTCVPFIRRQLFHLFYLTHILGALVFMLFGFMHRKDVAPWVMPGVFLYLLDVVLRTIQQNFNATRISTVAPIEADGTLSGAANAVVSPDGGTLSLSIKCDKSLSWVGADHVFLNVPAVSWWQWHPFTLASSSATAEDGTGERKMVLHIKKYDTWTKCLIARLSSDAAPLALYVSGPYLGANRQWLHAFTRHVFVAGGIGVTPALGMLQELIATRRAAAASASSFSRVSFIWISRSVDELGALPVEVLEEAGRGKDGWLDLQLYHTGNESQAAAADVKGTTAADAAGAIVPGVRGCYGHRTASDVAVTVLCAPGFVLSAAAASAVKAKPLAHPYMFHPLLWAANLVLCFVGGFGGLMCVQSYDAHIARTVRTRFDFSYVGMLQFTALGFGAVLGPAVLMTAVHMYRAFTARRTAAADSSPAVTPASSAKALNMAPPTVTINALARLPSNDNTSDSASDSGSGIAIAADALPLPSAKGAALLSSSSPSPASHAAAVAAYTTRGRPDLVTILAHAAAVVTDSDGSDSGAEECVGVFAGGPPRLVGMIDDACAALNGLWGPGAPGRAFLQVHSVTYEM